MSKPREFWITKGYSEHMISETYPSEVRHEEATWIHVREVLPPDADLEALSEVEIRKQLSEHHLDEVEKREAVAWWLAGRDFGLITIRTPELSEAEKLAPGIEWAFEFLMINAGSYCNCKNIDGDQCDKHAQTFSAHQFRNEALRQGIKLKEKG